MLGELSKLRNMYQLKKYFSSENIRYLRFYKGYKEW